MNGTGVINNFLNTFTTYIDSGFGLIKGDVTWLASTLIAIDITLAGLFSALGNEPDVLAKLIRKTLYIGFFAWVLTNFNSLAQIVFQSFSSLGLKAAGSGLSSSDFLQPGKLAQVGLDAGRPILTAAGQLMGYVSFFQNFVQIFVLMISWLIVLIAFFILAVQLFISLIEFKLTTLTGFVLIPFALFNKTSFLAEKVLGNVVASGVKILVLAVITGIGTTLFSQFTAATGTNQPTLDDALSLVLAALALLGLGIFGPGIATGLVSGAPQLGLGGAVGTTMAAAGLGAAAATGATALGGAVIGASRKFWPGSNDSRPSAGTSGDGPTSTGPGGGSSGSSTPNGLSSPASPAPSSFTTGSSQTSSAASPPTAPPSKPAPAWANRLISPQSLGQHISSVEQGLSKTEHAGGSASISLAERDQP
jgi:type IV secretion system protein TrbL